MWQRGGMAISGGDGFPYNRKYHNCACIFKLCSRYHFHYEAQSSQLRDIFGSRKRVIDGQVVTGNGTQN